jgi:hypothetical protein
MRVQRSELITTDRQHILLTVIWLGLTGLFLSLTVFVWTNCTVITLLIQVWIVNGTALLVICPPLVTAFMSRQYQSLFPFLQICSVAYLIIAETVNMHTRYTYLMPPFIVGWIVCIYFSDYRVLTKLFQVIVLGQTVMVFLHLDNILTLAWDATMFPTFATYIVSTHIM